MIKNIDVLTCDICGRDVDKFACAYESNPFDDTIKDVKRSVSILVNNDELGVVEKLDVCLICNSLILNYIDNLKEGI